MAGANDATGTLVAQDPTSEPFAIGVNASLGASLPPLASDAAVDESGEGWFFDAARQHLIIKLKQVGDYCQ